MASAQTLQVAVLGAGVIGLSVATHLSTQLKEKAVVTVISENFSPHTTSDKAGAIILPFCLAQDGEEELKRIEGWFTSTTELFDRLYSSANAFETGVSLVHGYYADEEMGEVDPWWSGLVKGYRRVGRAERRQYNIPDVFIHVLAFSTYIVDCKIYLPWLLQQFKQSKGVIERRRVQSLSEVRSYDVVVNCTGLGAKTLVGDSFLHPVRGDCVVVKAPWVKEFRFLLRKGSASYIFPRVTNVLLGGTLMDNVWSEEPNEEAASAILLKCSAMIPSLARAEVETIAAGLRPVRNSVRLEREIDGRNGSVLIHCYGHSGQGISLFWGCALEVGQIVNSYLKTLETSSAMSAKL